MCLQAEGILLTRVLLLLAQPVPSHVWICTAHLLKIDSYCVKKGSKSGNFDEK